MICDGFHKFDHNNIYKLFYILLTFITEYVIKFFLINIVLNLICQHLNSSIFSICSVSIISFIEIWYLINLTRKHFENKFQLAYMYANVY